MKKLSFIWKMKTLSFIMMTALCVTLWSCSDDDDDVTADTEEEQTATDEEDDSSDTTEETDEETTEETDEETGEEEDTEVAAQEYICDFEGLLTEEETYFQAEDGEAFGEWGYYQSSFTDIDGLANFTHFYASWGFGGGFTYCNTTDTTTPGYTNLSAITAGGYDGGTTYLTASTANEVTVTNLNPDANLFKGAYITNTTYAYLAMAEGDDGNGDYAYVTKFDDSSYFTLTATGYTAEGEEIASLDFALATGTDILDEWSWFDWTEIGSAAYITFSMDSSDTGDYGMNTPAYFCLDDVTFIEATE